MIKNSKGQKLLTAIQAVLFMTAILFFSSCQKEEPVEPQKETEHQDEVALKCSQRGGFGLLLDYELVNAMTVDQIKAATGPAFEALVQYDVELYKVIYLSKYRGRLVTVSGVVSVPVTNVNRNTPVVMYNHGTRVSDGDLVPSSGMDLVPVVSAANGKICFAADYVGYGESNDIFPAYTISDADVYPVCDMILAGQQFLYRKYRLWGKISLTMFGYSQGGPVTLAAQRELESNYFYKWFVKLNGVACGTGPYDFYESAVKPIVEQDTYSSPAFLVFSFISYNNFYHLGYDLDELFQNNYGQLFLDLRDQNIPYAQIEAQIPNNISELLQPDFRADFLAGNTPFSDFMDYNKVQVGWVPKSPLRLYHSIADEVVPYANAQVAFDAFTNAGATDVNLITYENFSHVTTAFVSLMDILAWASDN